MAVFEFPLPGQLHGDQLTDELAAAGIVARVQSAGGMVRITVDGTPTQAAVRGVVLAHLAAPSVRDRRTSRLRAAAADPLTPPLIVDVIRTLLGE